MIVYDIEVGKDDEKFIFSETNPESVLKWIVDMDIGSSLIIRKKEIAPETLEDLEETEIKVIE